MSHTLASIMALINDAINTAEKAEADHCSPTGSPSFRQSNADAREAEAALRLAVREVLAERESWKEKTASATNDAEHNYERCRELEAECERLRKDAERYLFLKTLEGQAEYIMVIRNKGAEHLDAAIDAAIAQERT